MDIVSFSVSEEDSGVEVDWENTIGAKMPSRIGKSRIVAGLIVGGENEAGVGAYYVNVG